jgi:hypothetical protein
VPAIGIGQAVTFFEKTLKKVAISPNPLWQALKVVIDPNFEEVSICIL